MSIPDTSAATYPPVTTIADLQQTIDAWIGQFEEGYWPPLANLARLTEEVGELARDERLFRFEFPERPGALMRFLAAMHPGWNISLFHYRNQGADYGRILVGIQVPQGDEPAFDGFLRSLAYPFVEETRNPVYGLFLR